MNLKELTSKVVQLAKQTGEMLLDKRKSITAEDIEVKGKNDFVTRFDKMSEEKIVARLSELLPEAGFIAEEGTSTKVGKTYNWIIDPIDGTTNFMHGAPPFSISIALQEKDAIIIGVVYDIFSGECFYSSKGDKVYLNGVEVTSSKTKTVKDSLFATGFPYKDLGRMDRFMQSLTFFMDNSHGLRRLGSAAVDLAYVACGRYDGFYEYGLKSYDVAAGAFLVKQAGGEVSDFKGNNNYIFGQEIVAGNGYNFSEFRLAVGKLMNDDSKA